MTATALAQRIRGWRDDGAAPYWCVWNRAGRRRVALGGGRTRGWVLIPRLTVDLRQLTVGVTWQANEFEDPVPLVALHIPGVHLWARVYRVHAGYRSIPRDQRDHPGGTGEWGDLA